MPAVIRLSEVRHALRPCLGSAMVDGTDIAEQAAQAMRSFASYRDTFESLAERVANVLFNALYSALGPSMTVQLDDGRLSRIRISDLPGIADECLYVLFSSMAVYSVTYQNLKDYAMRAGSISAMRVLWEKYDAFQSAEEKQLLARVVRENCPQDRQTDWLKESDAQHLPG